MAKIESIKFSDFMTDGWRKPASKQVVSKVISAAAPILVIITPESVLAAGVDGAFGNIHNAIMQGFDAGVVLVIIFAGAAWGLGHRTKAIEILIGVCCGYILARHAVDIRDFLKGI